jgi:hypothetical protein
MKCSLTQYGVSTTDLKKSIERNRNQYKEDVERLESELEDIRDRTTGRIEELEK